MSQSTTETPVQALARGLKSYYPEMNEVKPAAAIEASLGHYGKHWYLRTTLTLKGRGIVDRGPIKASELTEKGQRLAGWNQYKVTERAFETICETHTVVTESLL